MSPSQLANECRTGTDTALSKLLEQRRDNLDPVLADAMTYSLLAGGKRLRPMLVHAAALACGVPGSLTGDAACAVELIHAYSLIHDDLPAMDDDDLRRGQPSCHCAFDEATAILAGDALQSLAFEVLAASDDRPAQRLQMIRLLTQAGGMQGMVLGQAIDLAATGSDLDEAALGRMHAHKTGALIRASVLLGALSVGEQARLQSLGTFGNSLGLAFQIRDDILDVAGKTEELGKQQGADQQQAKPTYTSMLGMEAARKYAQQARDEALGSLAQFGAEADFLRYLADQAVVRTN